MKFQLLLIIAVFTISGNAYAGVKDSASKYEGTTYIGDIFKDYEWLPDPIKNHNTISLLNSFGLFEGRIHNPYEIGIRYLYSIPLWNDGPIGWNNTSVGAYYKYYPDKKYDLQTIGLAISGKWNSGIFFDVNEGIIWYKDKLDNVGFELEIAFGYNMIFNYWILSPVLKYNASFSRGDIRYDDNFDIMKPLLQLGINIGYNF